MTKAHASADREQVVRLCGGRDGVADAEPPGHAPKQRRLAHRLGRGHEQQPLGVQRERLEPPLEALLYSPRKGTLSGRPKPPASSAAPSPRGSSNGASGLPRVSATIRSRTRSSSGPVITESSSAAVEAFDKELWQGHVFGPLAARCEHHRDSLRQ
jgi:hypothetical protein